MEPWRIGKGLFSFVRWHSVHGLVFGGPAVQCVVSGKGSMVSGKGFVETAKWSVVSGKWFAITAKGSVVLREW